MNINFNDATFEKLRFLADREGRSVAAFVSMRMDELAGQLVNTTFTINEIPPGVKLAHLDPTPRPAPVRNDEQAFYVLPGDNANRKAYDPAGAQERRYAEDQY
ncbi:hypothetical protein [Enterobacter hormaechei]|uniref:hypothetical protein n=1 Tax=Enterobacter hormaechei TaxID=158836 RepID=UPI0030767323